MIYWQSNKNHTDGAFLIRDAFKAAFLSKFGEDCHDMFHNDKSCILDADLAPAGPFLTANWSAFILPVNFQETVMWIM